MREREKVRDKEREREREKARVFFIFTTSSLIISTFAAGMKAFSDKPSVATTTTKPTKPSSSVKNVISKIRESIESQLNDSQFHESKDFKDFSGIEDIKLRRLPSRRCLSFYQKIHPDGAKSRLDSFFFSKAYELYSLYDRDNDGLIKPSEAVKVIRSLSLNPSDTEFSSALLSLKNSILEQDPNLIISFRQNGKPLFYKKGIDEPIENEVLAGVTDLNEISVDFVDVIALFIYLEESESLFNEGGLTEAFHTFSLQVKDDFIEKKVLKDLLKNHGERLSEEEINDLFSYSISDESGQLINYSKLIKKLIHLDN